MKVEIEYCGRWNYEPEALRVRDRLQKLGSHDIVLQVGGSGVFDVCVDGRVVFSKKNSGRFPRDDEIDAMCAR